MPERIKFSSQTFTFLFKKIFIKATGTNKNISNDAIKAYIKEFGIGKFFGDKTPYENDDGCYPEPREKKPGIYVLDIDAPPLKTNLKTWMLEDPAVKELLKKRYFETERIKYLFYTKYGYQGRRLRDLYNKLFDKDTSIKLGSSKDYSEVFLTYAGYDSVEELKKQITPQAPLSPGERREKKSVRYQGFFYHFHKHEVQSFELSIDYASTPLLPVEQRKFHNGIDGAPLYGNGELNTDGKIYASLVQKNTQRRIELIIESGNHPQGEEAMLCSIQTISNYNRVVVMEAVIVKTEVIKENPSLVTEIKRYLFLHRYCFRLQEPPLNLKNLAARKVFVKAIDQMVGAFRVWSFDEEFNIIQSRMVINEYYRALHFTRQYEGDQVHFNKQYCILKVTNHLHGNSSLCITTHPDGSTEIIAQIVLKVLDRKHKEKAKITGGVMSLTNHKEGFPAGRAIVLMKEADPNFELKTIASGQVEDLINNNRDLVMLYSTLKDIQKSMTPSEVTTRKG